MTTADPGYAAQPIDDDFDTEVLPVRRRPRLPLLTAILVLALIAAAAFVGGVEIQKHYGGGSSSASAATGSGAGAAAARFGAAGARTGRTGLGAAGGGGGGGAGAFFGGGAGGGATGLVTLIQGSTLYVTDFSGNTVKVKLGASASVTKTVSTSLKGVHPGDSVMVRGTKAKNGTLTASSVTIANG